MGGNSKEAVPGIGASIEVDNRRMPFKARLRYFLIRNTILGLGRLAAVMPEKMTYAACVRLVLFLKKALPKFSTLARTHLEIAFGGEKSPQEIDAILHQTYINYGKSFAEFLMLPHKDVAWLEKKVSFHDPNWNVRTEYEKGRGAVSLGGHFGSWEMVGARLGSYAKYPLVIVVKAQRDAFMSKFVMETRQKWGNEYIFRERGIKEECLRQLAMGKVIGLIADQNASRGIPVQFFGKPAMTATGPAEIAMKHGLPVIPSFPARNPDDTVTLYVLDPIPMRDTGNYADDLAYNVQQCNKAVEDFARLHPAEYFWWHRRWKNKPKPSMKTDNQ